MCAEPGSQIPIPNSERVARGRDIVSNSQPSGEACTNVQLKPLPMSAPARRLHPPWRAVAPASADPATSANLQLACGTSGEEKE